MRTIQIGLEWQPERAGGLPRYYHELWKASGGVFDFAGMVMSSPNVAKETQGAIVSFARQRANLLTKYLGAQRSFRALKARSPTTLVASHFALSTFPVLNRIDTPLVVHFHGPWASESASSGQNRLPTAAKLYIEKSVYTRATRAIALSAAFADILAKTYGFPRHKIDIVPGGVNFSRFNTGQSRSEARQELGWNQHSFIIACVRRLVPRMGHANLVAAAEVLAAKHREVEFKLIGSGPIKGDLSALISAKGLQNQVNLVGRVSEDELSLIYRAADMTIVPSIELEGFGLVVLESLASGTPALVTAVGGLEELIAPLAPQLIVPTAHPNQLAQAIEFAMVDRNLPSPAACQAYAARFDWPIIAGRIRDVYGRAL